MIFQGGGLDPLSPPLDPHLTIIAIILTRERELVALLLLSFGCLVVVGVLSLFLRVPWVGLQFVIVVFPDLLRCVAPILAATDATYLGIRHSTDFRVLSGERQQQ